MGGNLGIENVKHKGSLSAVEETSAAKFKKILCQTWGGLAKHGVIATAPRPKPKPCVTPWNSKESRLRLPEEKCVGNLRLISFFQIKMPREGHSGLHN